MIGRATYFRIRNIDEGVGSDISGRGVGMDAVRQFLLDQGGDIEIVLGDSSITEGMVAKNSDFIPFQVDIILPCSNFILVG